LGGLDPRTMPKQLPPRNPLLALLIRAAQEAPWRSAACALLVLMAAAVPVALAVLSGWLVDAVIGLSRRSWRSDEVTAAYVLAMSLALVFFLGQLADALRNQLARELGH